MKLENQIQILTKVVVFLIEKYTNSIKSNQRLLSIAGIK